ncbi:MAG TPA: hypothetical protein VGI30_06705 [Caulobacteraceae bacterium]|jgi:hypothetical protein
MPENAEKDRRELIREAEREKTLLHDAIDHAVAPIARQLAEVETKLDRLKHDLPAGDICPMCWYGHGVTSRMRETPEKPANPIRNRFACRTCGHFELRRV